MNTPWRSLIALIMGAFCSLAIASTTPQQTQETISANVAKLGLSAKHISPSPLPNMFEVMTERGILYISADGEYLFHGQLYQFDEGITNVTEQALAKIRVSEIQQATDGMIVYPAENEQYKVSVFTDVSCGYCRRLHTQMAEYNKLGITVQYLAFPRSGTQGATYQQLQQIWCAKNPQLSMNTAMSTGAIDSAQSDCQDPVADQFQLGLQVGVDSTPSIILANGTMIPGYQTPEQLLATIKGG